MKHKYPHERRVPRLSPLNILLAEDERSVAFSLVFALKTDGHNVQVVADGWQALISINVEPGRFGLLITDRSMPGMTGVELTQRLREESFRARSWCSRRIYRPRTAPPTRRSRWMRWSRSHSTCTNCAPPSRVWRTG